MQMVLNSSVDLLEFKIRLIQNWKCKVISGPACADFPEVLYYNRTSTFLQKLWEAGVSADPLLMLQSLPSLIISVGNLTEILHPGP